MLAWLGVRRRDDALSRPGVCHDVREVHERLPVHAHVQYLGMSATTTECNEPSYKLPLMPLTILQKVQACNNRSVISLISYNNF